ncbi:hypothetical protein Ahy_A08g037815 [Arachis hypogaea]|uniref:Histone chaperone ASF1B n=1 Tax=Arachis hypogaea TaxID=3818 RepID=A0A445BS03_ARAHY|nr:hypothetical protein Ahy_A08g037815 [Arachis hypogaea]
MISDQPQGLNVSLLSKPLTTGPQSLSRHSLTSLTAGVVALKLSSPVSLTHLLSRTRARRLALKLVVPLCVVSRRRQKQTEPASGPSAGGRCRLLASAVSWSASFTVSWSLGREYAWLQASNSRQYPRVKVRARASLKSVWQSGRFQKRRMSAVNITNVTVLDNPASFLTPFQFEISYECLTPLKDDLEWKLIYVGSAEDETYDQLLESVLVGPADPPDPSKIREEDIIGVTVLLLTCSYLGQEFIRVGYYVNNDYDDEQLREEPPPNVLVDRVQRNILSDKPRVTKFPINFHPENNENEEQPGPAENPSETREDPLADGDCDPSDEKDS